MQDKTKNKIITIGFIVFIVFFLFVNILSKDKEISTTERRKLAQLPKLTINKILNTTAMDEWEKYAEDQFIKRDSFRNIKSYWNTYIFKQKDNNQLFEKDNAIYKMEYVLKEENIKKSAQKINEIYQKHLKNMNVYYSVIPDKNHYLENDDHLKMNYNDVIKITEEQLADIKFIDISKSLDLSDYYRTDLHWKQENLQNVVKTIESNMNLSNTNIKYNIQNKGDFYGAYYGQLATNVSPDKLKVLTNETIKKCTTYNYETQKTNAIYVETTSADKYDIFLSGATSLITIDNPNAQTDKELLLFRDSFGSSLAPLLVENYKKITLIDLRYISSELLSNYIEFTNQDVLFIYSTLILNQNILK